MCVHQAGVIIWLPDWNLNEFAELGAFGHI